MSRISYRILAQAATKVQAMDMQQKEALADAVSRAQPALFGSVLALQQLGVSMNKLNFVLRQLLVAFQAMQDSGLRWRRFSEKDLEQQMQRYLATSGESHAEKDLYNYVQVEIADWMKRVEHEDSDKYVILAAINIVNCIAHLPLMP